MQQENGSALSRSVSVFCHTLSALGVFMLIPLAEQHVRPWFYSYFMQSFPHDISVYSSWGFIVVLLLSILFGVSSLLQVIVQLILRYTARRSVF